MKLLLIGPPGSGKTVVANKISEIFNIPFVKTGSLLREINQDNKNFKIIKESMEKGLLAPNNIVAEILEDNLKNYTSGYVLDGWMRQLSDRDFLDIPFDKVIFLNAPKEVCKDRVLNRVICRVHGSIYSFAEEVCSMCGGNLEKRSDDTDETFENRWSVYEKLTLPVIYYYKELGVLFEVDASKSIPEIVERLIKLND